MVVATRVHRYILTHLLRLVASRWAHATRSRSAGKRFLEANKIQGILDQIAFDFEIKRALKGERRAEVDLEEPRAAHMNDKRRDL